MGGRITDGAAEAKHSVLNSSFPVLLPYDETLFLPDDKFFPTIKEAVSHRRSPRVEPSEQQIDRAEVVFTGPGSLKRQASGEIPTQPPPKAPFVAGLEHFKGLPSTEDALAAENKTVTANGDVTNISSNNPLVDLFYDLGGRTQPDTLGLLLGKAWDADPLMTLKIIFNTRSIHLGKSDKIATYKAFGWLAETHPNTLLKNLSWLVRPVIKKKTSTAKSNTADALIPQTESTQGIATCDVKGEEDDFDMIDAPEAIHSDAAKVHDVPFGVSHGYWKDLLNLVALAANDELKLTGRPATLLFQKQDRDKDAKLNRVWDPQQAKALRKQKIMEQNQRVTERLQKDGFYRGLHYTVARLFAQQLKEDFKLLHSDKKSDLKSLSLAAKWSPSFGEFHDKHTFILSSIAELLYPNAADICPDASNREQYLRHARESFRKNYASPLRKALAVVERDIAAGTFSNIQYERVPSLAMDRYSSLFLNKDFDHFSAYINDVAAGKANISGATLLPSTIVHKASTVLWPAPDSVNLHPSLRPTAKDLVAGQIIDGQWKTLVQRIRDSGTLRASIAIADVSGSMGFVRFADGTCPLDASTGLSLLVAETTAPPFGGGFITFSEQPAYVSVGGPTDTRSFIEKTRVIYQSAWMMNTDLVAVFERLILPMALENKLEPEDMVKQVFVFSDMQFDEAETGSGCWSSSYGRIKEAYARAGYEVPRLVFWNLAGDATDKPVTSDDAGVALVSGYSQGMLKVFLDGGGFEPEGEVELVEEDVGCGDQDMLAVKVERKVDAMTLVRKAVSHTAYDMLEVVD